MSAMMFVKITSFEKWTSHVIACMGVRDSINGNGDLQLDFDGATVNSYIIGKDRKETTGIYYLNNEGKTIEKLTWGHKKIKSD